MEFEGYQDDTTTTAAGGVVATVAGEEEEEEEEEEEGMRMNPVVETDVGVYDDAESAELDENSDNTFDQPSRLRNMRLKQHQRALLGRCLAMETDGVPLRRNGRLRTKMGIIGDKVGSGKSFIILSLVLSDVTPEIKPSMESHAMDMVHVTRLVNRSGTRDSQTNLLVVPHNLCLQWSDCIRRYCAEDLTHFVVSKSAHLTTLIEEDGFAQYDLIIVTSTFYNAVAQAFNARRIRLKRVIYDEADSIKIARCRKIRDCRFTWFVTASFTNLICDNYSRKIHDTSDPRRYGGVHITSTGHIRDIFAEVKATMYPDDIASLVVKNKDSFVDASFALPDPVTHVVECKNSYVIDILQGNVDAGLLDRLNAEDVRGAMRLVDPDSLQTEKSIVDILVRSYVSKCDALGTMIAQMQAREDRRRDGAFLQRASISEPQSRCPSAASSSSFENNEENQEEEEEESIPSDRTRGSTTEVHSVSVLSLSSPMMMRRTIQNGPGPAAERLEGRIHTLKKERERIECRVQSIRERITGCDVCTICYEDFRSKTIAKCCSHAYCFGCINVWLKSQKCCPMCKGHLDLGKLLVVNDTNDETVTGSLENDIRPTNSKLANFEGLIRRLDAEGRKVMVCSNYDTSLTKVREVLSRRSIESGTLKGTIGHIRRLLDRYSCSTDAERGQRLNVLLVNASDYGSGMNLQITTDIIMFHRLDDNIEKQVIGRAQRCGRTAPLNVWYLLHGNEFDAKTE
jgi:hypothetical protein